MMDESKTVLLIIPSLTKGGAEKIFLDQLDFYSRHCKTIGCVFNWDNSSETNHAGNIFSLEVPGGKNIFYKGYYFWLRVVRLYRFKKKNRIDVSISHLEGADYINILSRSNEKIFCWIHGTKKFDENITGLIGWLRKKIMIPSLYSKSDWLIAVSDGIREELIAEFKLPPTKIQTVFNGFDIPEIEIKAAEQMSVTFEALLNDKPMLITHCRLARQKNLVALLNIITVIKATTEVKLFILGDGELRDHLIDFAESKELKVYNAWSAMALTSTYDVYFLGFQDNPYPYLRRASLYIMTSSWEGFPLALCEAMACKLPVLAADCYTGPREILAAPINLTAPVSQPWFSAFGVLMPLAENDTIQIWANTICSVLQDQGLRKSLSNNASRRVQDFDKKEITQKWLTIVNE